MISCACGSLFYPGARAPDFFSDLRPASDQQDDLRGLHRVGSTVQTRSHSLLEA